MAKKVPAIYSKDTLEEMLGYIEIYWHRHGGEEQEKLERYIRKLHSALPVELTLGQPSAVSLGDLSEGIAGILSPVGYSKDEIDEEVAALENHLELTGGAEIGLDDMLVRPGEFEKAFDSYFSTADLAESAFEQLAELRRRLLS